MSRPFVCQTNSRLLFLDILILEFYDRARQRGIGVVARHIVRRFAVTDPAVQPEALKVLAPEISKLTSDPAYLKEACTEADELPEIRAGRSPMSPDSARRVPTQTEFKDETPAYIIRISPYELLVLEFYLRHWGLESREKALMALIRFFAKADRGISEGAFRKFSETVLQQYPRRDWPKLRAEVDAFFKVNLKARSA